MAFKHELDGVAANDPILDSTSRHQAVVDANNVEIRSLLLPVQARFAADVAFPEAVWQADINPLPTFDAIAGRTPQLTSSVIVYNVTSYDIRLRELVTLDEVLVAGVAGDSPQRATLVAVSNWLAQVELRFVLEIENVVGFNAQAYGEIAGLWELKL